MVKTSKRVVLALLEKETFPRALSGDIMQQYHHIDGWPEVLALFGLYTPSTHHATLEALAQYPVPQYVFAHHGGRDDLEMAVVIYSYDGRSFFVVSSEQQYFGGDNTFHGEWAPTPVALGHIRAKCQEEDTVFWLEESAIMAWIEEVEALCTSS